MTAMKTDVTNGVSPLRNRNILVALAFTFLSSAARNVWSFVVLSNYLQLLTHSKSDVGIAEGLQGGAQAIFAVLSGVVADRWRCDRVLLLGGSLGVVAIVLIIAGLLLPDIDDSDRFVFLVVALSIFGAYQGVWTTVLETLIANSVPTGTRSTVLTLKFMLMQAASVSGPIVAVSVFVAQEGTCSGEWSLGPLRTVFVAGAAFGIPGALLLGFTDDRRALGVASEPITSPLLRPTESKGQEELDARLGAGRCVCSILIASDLLSGFGSGMTIKFFPLWFSEVLKLGFCETSGIYVALPLFMAAASWLLRRLAQRIGRVQACLIGTYIGAAALFGLAAVGWWGGDLSSNYKLLVPLYLLSTTQHGTRPLKKSILMDYVSKSSRSRWNAIDSVTRFGWSGSAVLGGYLLRASDDDFSVAFSATAASQAAAGTLLWALLPLVSVQESVPDADLLENNNANSESSAAARASSSFSATLLEGWRSPMLPKAVS